MKYILGANYVFSSIVNASAVIKCNRCNEHIEVSSTEKKVCLCGREFTLEPKVMVFYDRPYDQFDPG